MRKKTYELARAREVAEEVKALITPACTRVEIVGSIRRGRPRVHDIDLLAIPRLQTVRTGLFDKEKQSMLDAHLVELSFREEVHLRARGPKHKRLVHRTGVPVDIYLADIESWPLLLVIRTGSAAFNRRICTDARARGLVVHADGRGIEGGGRRQPTRPKSEKGVFRVLSMPYVPPAQREA